MDSTTLSLIAISLCFVVLTAAPLSAAPPIAELARTMGWEIDQPGYIRQFDPIFCSPIRRGTNALPIGNGDLAAVLWEPGPLTWMLNKCDLGNTSQAAQLTIRTTGKPLADRVGTLQTRLSLDQATATVTYDGGKLPQDAGWIWRLKSGKAPTPTDEDLGTVRVQSYVPMGRNVLLIDYNDQPKTPHGLSIELRRWVQREWGTKVVAEVGDGVAVIDYQRKDNSRFCVAMCWDGFKGAKLSLAGPIQANLEMAPATALQGRLAVAVVTSNEAADPKAAAIKLAQSTLGENQAALRQSNQDAWRDFWGREMVDPGHPYLNALYHMAIYELGATSRGSQAVQFNGGLNLWSEATRAWGGAYWCHNQSEVYLGTYAANHGELSDNFLDWIVRMLPQARLAAQKYFQVEGAFYPETMPLNFAVTDPQKPLKPDGMYLILSSGVRYSMLLWDRYQYSLDKDFLRKAYTVIHACAQFYVNYGKLGKDGLYHVDHATSWEEPPVGNDSHADCAAWRAIFPIAIQSAQILGVDADLLPVWKERLAKAPPFPISDGCFSVVMRDDGTPEPTNHFQWQLPNLSGVFPYSVIGIGGDQKLKGIAEATFDRYRFNADAGHEFLPVVAARLGLREGWRDAMFRYIQYFQVYDQGLFNYYNVHGQKDWQMGNTAELHPYLESSGNLMTATNEMLLQSYEGILRVFPAMPAHWSGRFILRAQGSFLIAADRKASGGVQRIAVQAVGGETRPCRIAIPWSAQTRVTDDGKVVEARSGDGAISFNTEPGRCYLIQPAGSAAIAPVKIGFERACSPMRFGNVWFGSSDTTASHSNWFPLW